MDKELKREIRKNSNINSLILLLFFAFVFLFAIADSFVISIFADPESLKFRHIYKLTAYIFQYAVTVPVMLLIFRAVKRNEDIHPLRESFCKPEMPAGWVIKWIVIALGMSYAVTYVSGILFSLLQALTGTELHPADFSADNSAFDRITNILAITILAPVFEELLFRATLFRNIEKYGAWSMVVVSGITFGLWHRNYEQMIYTATLGMFSCFLVSKTKSVIPSLSIHFIMNLIGGIQSLFIGNVDVENASFGSSFGSIAILFLLGMIVIGIAITGLVLFIIEAIKHPNSFKLENKLPEVSTGKKLAAFFTAPLTIILFAFMIFSTVFNALNA